MRIIRAVGSMRYGAAVDRHNLRYVSGMSARNYLGHFTMEDVAEYLEKLNAVLQSAADRSTRESRELKQLQDQKRAVGTFLLEAMGMAK